MFESIGSSLLISLLLGAAIGLERQSALSSDSNDPADAGIRTFSLIALLGCLSSIFYIRELPVVFILISTGFLILVCSHYILVSLASKDFGFTTEISFILTFVIGICAGTNILQLQMTVAIAVVIIVILSLKGRSQKFLEGISRNEIESFISFAILGLVILPFLTNASYKLTDFPVVMTLFEGMRLDVSRFSEIELINPQQMWFIVVLITGIDVFGYFLSKYVGAKRGFTVTSFVGGFVSSTLTTQSLAQKSKSTAETNYLVGAAVLANQASFFQIFLLVGPLNASLLITILPTLLIMIATSAILVFYFLRKKDATAKEAGADQAKSGEKRIFSIIPALQFSLLILIVKFVTSLCLVFFGKAGFALSSVIASFAGIDAVLVNLAGAAGGSISHGFALFVFVLVNATNLSAKTFYCFLQGSREFTWKFALSVLIIILSSFLGFLFL